MYDGDDKKESNIHIKDHLKWNFKQEKQAKMIFYMRGWEMEEKERSDGKWKKKRDLYL